MKHSGHIWVMVNEINIYFTDRLFHFNNGHNRNYCYAPTIESQQVNRWSEHNGQNNKKISCNMFDMITMFYATPSNLNLIFHPEIKVQCFILFYCI